VESLQDGISQGKFAMAYHPVGCPAILAVTLRLPDLCVNSDAVDDSCSLRFAARTRTSSPLTGLRISLIIISLTVNTVLRRAFKFCKSPTYFRPRGGVKVASARMRGANRSVVRVRCYRKIAHVGMPTTCRDQLRVNAIRVFAAGSSFNLHRHGSQ
jgi:hypothetical protein